MAPKMIWANLASSDLERTIDFYTRLGFKSKGKSEEIASICFGDENFVINFLVKPRFETATKSHVANLAQHNEIIFSISAENKEEVDSWVERIVNAGGSIFAEPQPIDKGYTMGFTDPDGHKFNILYWPGI